MNYWWYFIPFLLVPILVHLFDFRKTKKLYFSSIKYIAELTSKSKAKSRLKHFLILTNRLFIFLLIVLLLWHFFYDASGSDNNAGSVGVYYDNSISSVLNDSDLKVEEGLRQLSKQTGTMLFFDNISKTLIDKDALVTISIQKSQQSQNTGSVFRKFEDNRISSHYLFSDFQRTDLQELESFMADSLKNYQLILTNDLNTIRNVSVDSLYLLPNEDNLAELSILVDFNVDNMTAGSIVVKLIHETRQLSSVVKDVSELNNVRFDIAKDTYGKFEIAIDGDDVGFDNTFHFTVGEKLKSKIVVLESRVSQLLGAVYENSELFDLVYQDVNNLDYDVLRDSDLIVISDQFTLPQAMQAQLDGTSFIVFPKDSIDVSAYEKFVGVNLTPIERVLSEASVDSDHPLFKGVFERRIEDGSLPSETPLFSVSGEFEPIIGYRSGNTFLLKKDNVYFLNSSLNQSSSGFQSNALFLPILYQIAFTSTGSLETPYYYPGDRVVSSTSATDVPIKILRDNYEVIPTFNTSGARVVLELPEDLEPGKYHLIQGNDTLQQIAVNIPKAESTMLAPTLAELKDSFANHKNVSISEIVNGSGNVVFISTSQSSLWKYALILTVVLILTETVLHRYLK